MGVQAGVQVGVRTVAEVRVRAGSGAGVEQEQDDIISNSAPALILLKESFILFKNIFLKNIFKKHPFQRLGPMG